MYWRMYTLLQLQGFFEAASLDVKQGIQTQQEESLHSYTSQDDTLIKVYGVRQLRIHATSKYMQPKILLTKRKIHKSLILFNFKTQI